ncbi:MAG: glycoside hydrolase family 16 protein [Clostridia bacterium]|nr:glycoside hydrolase family 16 protein [Clostridia bacterium]
MKKIKYFTAVVFLCLITAALLTSCYNPIGKISKRKVDLSNMQLVFEDNFDNGIDPKVWKTTFDSPIRRGGYWTSDQCFTENGNLIIQTEYKENGEHGAGWYTGTCLSQGLKEFTYGYFEVRCKTPPAQGLWSAFWLQSTSMANNEYTDNGKKGAEIDIMESPFYNDFQMPAETYRNTTMHTIHVNGYDDEHESTMSKYYTVQNNMYSEFNTYGLLWTKDSYTFYINGYESWKTNFGVSQVPEFLWLSVEIAGQSGSADPENGDNKFTWSGDIRNNPASAMPCRFVVDYVKVYQTK